MKKTFIRTSFKLILAAFAVITLVYVLANAIVVGSTSKYIHDISEIDKLEKTECVIVLGAKVYSEDSLCAVLQDRVDYAINIYKAGKADKLLFTGDHGRTEYDEVNAMMNYAVSNGVPEEDIFLDHAGFSTYESMYRAKDVFCVSDAIIVTQKFHISRAVYTARRMGIEAKGVNSNPRKYLNATYDALRESLARVKDFFIVNITKPEPTYLGEEIPITGDSGVTHDKE